MYQSRTVSAIIVAAGSGTRMGRDKLLMNLLEKSVIARSVDAFFKTGFFDEIIIVANEKNKEIFASELEKYGITENIKIITGGNTRGESSLLGIKNASGEFVMIHDGARPLVTEKIISDTLSACVANGAAAAGVKPKDTIKRISPSNVIAATVPRDSAVLIQTPQAFRKKEIENAYEKFGFEETDDCLLMEKMGASITVVEGSYENMKLTTEEDVITAEGILRKRGEAAFVSPVRIGTGFDTHRLTDNRKLIIGGVHIPYEKGLFGHSDADVLIHAIIDALFGAAALGDIGTHFPDTDEKYKGASSILLLREATQLVRKAGYEIGNVDTTLIAQTPKMAPYIKQMCENLAEAMGIPVSAVSVKAKSNEHMGFTGRGEGVEARAIVIIGK